MNLNSEEIQSYEEYDFLVDFIILISLILTTVVKL
jgi:hypothetical protein